MCSLSLFLSLSPFYLSLFFTAEVGLNLGVLRSRSGGLGSRSEVISAVLMEFEDSFSSPWAWLQSRSRSLTGGFSLASVVYPSSSTARELLGKSHMVSWLCGCVRFWGLRPMVFGSLFLSVLASGSSVDLWRSCVECPAGGSSALLVGLSCGSAW